MGTTKRPVVSNTAADKAANNLRVYFTTPSDDRSDALLRDAIGAWRTVAEYRAMHSYPMTKVTLGVRSMVKTATGDDTLRPGQRFKRMDRILVKLIRFPHMRLSQIEDIGGCRVVFRNLEQLYDAADHLMNRWDGHARITDYIDQPKPDGYRGIHIVEKRDRRMIEVQLRTAGQHEWAQAMEEYSPITGFNLKDGQAPADLRQYFRMAAYRIACHEDGTSVDSETEAEFGRLREQVLHYFQRSR